MKEIAVKIKYIGLKDLSKTRIETENIVEMEWADLKMMMDRANRLGTCSLYKDKLIAVVDKMFSIKQ